NLSGAELLIGFNNSAVGSILNQARMDSTTMLGDSGQHGSEKFQFDDGTCLLDVGWNGAVLANVRWETLLRLGDEDDIKQATTRKDRVEALHDAARAYRGLAKALQAQGLISDASRYRKREQQLERRALRNSFTTIGSWVFSCLLNIVSGYGDNPGRAGICYLLVIGTFTATYWAITNQMVGFITSHSAHLKWYEALVLSIVSFHGRGFFPTTLILDDPVALVAALEAIFGLFIELVLIATFTKRFFER
ncbi:MAG TPA: pentapeptide repeat-containing protein, partial [Ktedonobacterales bacterium]|nr:pentapeptide repeat-containing protein [Ktedonobacterales bacterium]